MNDARFSRTEDATAGQERLMELVEEMGEKLRKGDGFSIDEYVGRHPEYAEQLRQLLPTLMAMADLGYSVGEGEESAHDNAATPRVLGDFSIVRELGRGGMGVVYEAEQMSMNRRVALKMLPFAAVADSKALQRFKNEVRAAATLNHTHIVPVYSIGEERGIHYYAMQLIQGQTLAEIISELRQLRDDKVELSGASIAEVLHSSQGKSSASGADATLDHGSGAEETTPKAALSTVATHTNREFFRSAARLGVQAAEALDHAHDRGVLHRDIKPGNLMLDAESQLYITDFGLARIEADAGMTMTGDLVGTLRYMSPEQALAKRIVVDQRSDIYSLGVTLYELLTLEPAIIGQDRQEVLRQIAFSEPRKLRSINRAIPAELETIILKTLAKDPNERYTTAGELADDLQRYLDDQPIHAKPPNLAQRAAKWSRRHKPLVAAAVVLLVLASAGLAISNLLIGQERDLAQQERDEARRQEKRADENFRHAMAAVDQYLTTISEDTLLNAESLQPLRKKLLESAVTYYQKFIKERSGDTSLQAELANAYTRVAEITDQIGTKPQAIEFHRKSLEIREHLVADNPELSDHQLGRVNSLCSLGSLYQALGDFPKSVKTLELAVRLSIELRARDPDDPQFRAMLAKAHRHLADVKTAIGEEVQARASFQVAIKLLEGLVKQGHKVYRGDLAKAYSSYVSPLEIYSELGRSLIQSAIDIQEELVAEDPKSITSKLSLASFYSNLCINQREKCPDKAVDSGQRSVDLLVPLVRDNPAVTQGKDGLANVYHNIAVAHRMKGAATEAIALFKKAISTREELVAEHPAVVRYRHYLGKHYAQLCEVLRGAGKWQEEIAASTLGAEVWRRLAEDYPNDPERFQDNFLIVSTNLARSQIRIGDLDAAKATLEATLGIVKTNSGSYRKSILVKLHGVFVETLYKLEETGAARAAHEEAIEILNNKPRDDFAYQTYAFCLQQAGRPDDAIDTLTIGIERNPNSAGLYFYRAIQYQQLAEPEKVIADAKKGFKLHPNQNSYGYHRLAQGYHSSGDLNEAVKVFREHLEKEPNSAWSHYLIAKVYVDMGDFKKALEAHSLGAKQKEYMGYEHFAWLLSNCPEKELRNYEMALEFAGKVATPDSGNGAGRNTLAAALYRMGDFAGAIKTLESALQLEDDKSDFNDCMQTFHHFFLAMAHHQLGHKPEATKYHGLAVKSTPESLKKLKQLARYPSHEIHRTVKDLESLSAEAGELFGSDAEEK